MDLGLHALDVLDVVALVRDAPRRDRPRRGIVVVQALGLQVCLERRRRLHRVVARQVGEEVVGHVGGSDVVVHPVEDAVRAVDGAQPAAHPGPLVLAEVRQVRGRVLQPGVQDQPEVAPEVGRPVGPVHAAVAEDFAGLVQPVEGQQTAERREVHAHVPLPVRRKELGPGAEMVVHRRHALPLGRATRSRRVEEEVHGPAEQQVRHELVHRESVLADDVVHGFERALVLARGRHVRFPVQQVVGLGGCLACSTATRSTARAGRSGKPTRRRRSRSCCLRTPRGRTRGREPTTP